MSYLQKHLYYAGDNCSARTTAINQTCMHTLSFDLILILLDQQTNCLYFFFKNNYYLFFLPFLGLI